VNWFSTKVRVACLIEGVGLVRYMDSIHVFHAENFDEAMQRALVLGRGHEEEYVNSNQEHVRWRLKEIVSLDILQQGLSDGIEIYSEPVEPGLTEFFDYDAKFNPDTSTPTQTI
jgi:hypothetical protein